MSECCGHGQCSGQYDRYTQHCNCNAGWSGARCNTGTGPPPPPPSCPSHSSPNSAGTGCACDDGYQVNSAGNGCEPVAAPPPPAPPPAALPVVDYCVDPGNAINNPNAEIYECRHECDILRDQSWEAAEAAGCNNDHEDEVCVSEGVQAPGEADQWGEVCCESCEDLDGDGAPDYESCCSGMRADGELGCEQLYCTFRCNGLYCDLHEDQTACHEANGVWALFGTCEEMIAIQPQMAMQVPGEASPFWLGLYGSTCCTGYEVPGAGSCDSSQDLYVSSMVLCVYGLGLNAAISDAVPCALMPTE